jgi:hypothetical protein
MISSLHGLLMVELKGLEAKDLYGSTSFFFKMQACRNNLGFIENKVVAWLQIGCYVSKMIWNYVSLNARHQARIVPIGAWVRSYSVIWEMIIIIFNTNMTGIIHACKTKTCGEIILHKKIEARRFGLQF